MPQKGKRIDTFCQESLLLVPWSIYRVPNVEKHFKLWSPGADLRFFATSKSLSLKKGSKMKLGDQLITLEHLYL